MEEFSPKRARAMLAEEVSVLQRKVSSLLVLRGGDGRRAQLEEFQRELTSRQDDLKVLDAMYDVNSRTAVPPAPPGLAFATVRDSAANFSTRIPTDLPKFRGNGDNPDVFIESLGNSLLAHDVDSSRWTSALLLSCTEQVDAAWVRDNLLSTP